MKVVSASGSEDVVILMFSDILILSGQNNKTVKRCQLANDLAVAATAAFQVGQPKIKSLYIITSQSVSEPVYWEFPKVNSNKSNVMV